MYQFATDRVEAIRKLPGGILSLACGHSLAGVPMLCARAGPEFAVYVGTLEPVAGQPAGQEQLGATQMERVCTSTGAPIHGAAAAVGQDGTMLVADGDGAIWRSKAGQSSSASGGRMLPLAQLFWTPHGGDLVVEIACGDGHCLALTKAGELLSWGSGGHGQLGHGDDSDELTPRPVQMGQWRAGQRFTAIAAGHAHSAATCDRHQLYTWGDGGDGRLGHDASAPRRRAVPTALPTPHACEVAAGYSDTMLKRNDSWRVPACGERHTGCITSDGAVLTWGRGDWGRLGHGAPPTDALRPRHVRALSSELITGLALGHAHSAAVTQKGELWVWGTGAQGSPSWPWSLPGAEDLFAPPESFRVGLPCRVDGVLFSSWVAASRDTLVFTAEELTPLIPAALRRAGSQSAAARALAAAEVIPPFDVTRGLPRDPRSARTAHVERARLLRETASTDPRRARRLADEAELEATAAREEESMRGGRGVRRGVHMWHRALVLLAEDEPTLSRLAMKIERAREGQVSLTQSAYEKLTATSWTVPDLTALRAIDPAHCLPDASLLWTSEAELRSVPRTLLFDQPYRPGFLSESPRCTIPAQSSDLTPGPGAYLGLLKRTSEHVNSPLWGLAMDVAAPHNAHSRPVEAPPSVRMGYERERLGPYIRARTVDMTDLVMQKRAAAPGPGHYDLPDALSRPMPRRIKPQLRSRAPPRLVYDTFHLPNKAMPDLQAGRSTAPLVGSLEGSGGVVVTKGTGAGLPAPGTDGGGQPRARAPPHSAQDRKTRGRAGPHGQATSRPAGGASGMSGRKQREAGAPLDRSGPFEGDGVAPMAGSRRAAQQRAIAWAADV
jgi:hypothetical protein